MHRACSRKMKRMWGAEEASLAERWRTRTRDGQQSKDGEGGAPRVTRLEVDIDVPIKR